MAHRQPMPSKQSKRLFSNTAGSRHVHPKNTRPSPMRGGIRM